MSRQSALRASVYCMLTSEHTLSLYTKTNTHLHAKQRAGEGMESDSSIETGANHEEICQASMRNARNYAPALTQAALALV